MEMSMSISIKQNLELRQAVLLQQKIDLARMLALPNVVIEKVLQEIETNPDKVEKVLRAKKPTDQESKVIAICGELAPSRAGTREEITGFIPVPNLGALEGILSLEPTTLEIDAFYTARKGEKPEISFSQYLDTPKRLEIRLDLNEFPLVKRLLKALRSFEEWKKRKLIAAYSEFGDKQREYLENFDDALRHIFIQRDLADKISVSTGTVCRLLAGKLVQVTNLAKETRVFPAKTLFTSADELVRYNQAPKLNYLLAQELQTGCALSDEALCLQTNLNRRTITKWRNDSRIPDSRDRQEEYDARTRTQAYTF